MQRAALLKAAGDAVADRGLNYGQPEDNFARIARLWNAHLQNKDLLRHSYGVDETDVALMLSLVKTARLANDPTHADSWIDIAGYAACGGEVAKAGAPANENAPKPVAWDVREDIASGELMSLDAGAFGAMWEKGEEAPAPETKFGFTVGETVNAFGTEVGEAPGKVAGFADEWVLVQWSGQSPEWRWRPDNLRHGP